MSKLVQIEDDTWVDPLDVTSIQASRFTEYGPLLTKVWVARSDHVYVRTNVTDVAAKINEARRSLAGEEIHFPRCPELLGALVYTVCRWAEHTTLDEAGGVSLLRERLSETIALHLGDEAAGHLLGLEGDR